MAIKPNIIHFRRQDRSGSAQPRLLEMLFQQHGEALKGFLRVRLGVGHELDDIVQEVFVRLAKLDDLGERFPIQDKRNRSFIFKVANNYLRDLERRTAVRERYVQQQQSEQDTFSEIGLEREVEGIRQVDRLKAAVMELKPKCREAFVRNRFLSKSYKEVAEDMNISVKQVEKHIQKALMHVRKAHSEIVGMDES
ncbi:MAG: sigma-70 family RNA polymerase sigma factor [Porticoccaceae bacterium]|nr:sigma-70 family RNA polymerase sigma factor [Porticoccaceae bacterium]